MKILRGEENKILPLAKTVHYICYINIKKGEKAVVLFSSGDGVPVASQPRGRGVPVASRPRGRGVRSEPGVTLGGRGPQRCRGTGSGARGPQARNQSVLAHKLMCRKVTF